MKALFLTSKIIDYTKDDNGESIIHGCLNTNKIVENIRKNVNDIKKLAYVASNPEDFEKNKKFALYLKTALQKEGFSVKNIVVIDNGNNDIENNIKSADVVFLSGGHVPTQNEYFKKIKLKDILEKYNGVVIGQSAGSMNCSKVVYAQPECEEEFLDKNYQKYITGLGLTDITIMPHMNRAQIDSLCGETTYSLCIKDSYDCPHFGITDGGYILIKENVATAYGETIYFKNGKVNLLCRDGETYEISGEQLKQ